MRFNRILLTQAKYDSVFSNVLPAGIGYLSEYLTVHGVDNDVFDLNVEKNTINKLIEKIARYSPDLIGFSLMSLNYKSNYDVMQRLKERFPKIKIACGGAHLSTMRNDVLADCDAIDFGIVLEGEHTLLELVNKDVPLSKVKGLIWRDGVKVTYNGDRPFIEDLDSLPYPKYEKFDRNDYSSLISIFSSRGCPFECTYCPVKLAIGRRFVARSPKSVIEEIEYHYNKGYRDFSFRDDNFTLLKDRVYQVCDEIENKRFKGMYLMCDNGVRADKIDYRLLKRMKDVGFRMIGLGVESGSDRILASLKKSATVKIMEDAIKTACDLGYVVELYLLIGAPGETWQDFESTVALATKYPVMIASFYHLLPYPNTELFELAKKNNYLLRSPEEYLNDGSQRRNTPFMATPEFSAELRKKAFDYAYKTTSEHVKRSRRLYSKKNVYDKLVSAGFTDTLASIFSSVYSSSLLYDNVFNNKTMLGIKKWARKCAATKKEKVQA